MLLSRHLSHSYPSIHVHPFLSTFGLIASIVLSPFKRYHKVAVTGDTVGGGSKIRRGVKLVKRYASARRSDDCESRNHHLKDMVTKLQSERNVLVLYTPAREILFSGSKLVKQFNVLPATLIRGSHEGTNVFRQDREEYLAKGIIYHSY